MEYKNKNVVVTGASGGMGILLCEKLAASGANLGICSNDKNGLKEMAEKLRKNYGITVYATEIDITNENDVSNFIKECAEKLGALDFLANLAGLSIPNNYEDTEESVFDTIMDVNIKGSFLSSKYFAKFASDSALIINIGSMAARNTNANAPIYCMAKGAVNKLSEGLLLQLGKKNIRVTTINPGGTDTPFWGTRAIDRSKLMNAQDVVEIIYFIMGTSPNVQIHCIDFESFAKFN